MTLHRSAMTATMSLALYSKVSNAKSSFMNSFMLFMLLKLSSKFVDSPPRSKKRSRSSMLVSFSELALLLTGWEFPPDMGPPKPRLSSPLAVLSKLVRSIVMSWAAGCAGGSLLTGSSVNVALVKGL